MAGGDYTGHFEEVFLESLSMSCPDALLLPAKS